MNKIILVGRMTRDPELRTTTGDIQVCKFTLAVDKPFKGDADFIDCVVWRKQAENTAQYTGKGSLVAVEGRLQIRSYEDRDGIKRKAAEVVADNVRFLDKKGSSEPDLELPEADDPF